MIYSLRRLHGTRMPVYQLSADAPNLITGKITRSYSTVIITAIPITKDVVKVLTAKDGALLGATTESGLNVLVAGSDLPSWYTPKIGDMVRYDNKAYTFSKVKYSQYFQCYIIAGDLVTDSAALRILNVSLIDTVRLTRTMDLSKEAGS